MHAACWKLHLSKLKKTYLLQGNQALPVGELPSKKTLNPGTRASRTYPGYIQNPGKIPEFHSKSESFLNLEPVLRILAFHSRSGALTSTCWPRSSWSSWSSWTSWSSWSSLHGMGDQNGNNIYPGKGWKKNKSVYIYI